MHDLGRFGGLNNSTNKSILNMLKTNYITLQCYIASRMEKNENIRVKLITSRRKKKFQKTFNYFTETTSHYVCKRKLFVTQQNF